MLIEQIGSVTGCSLNPFQTQPSDFWLNIEFSSFNIQNIFFFNFNNLFLDKGVWAQALTHTNKNEISINLFPVCYQSLSIILFCSRSVKNYNFLLNLFNFLY